MDSPTKIKFSLNFFKTKFVTTFNRPGNLCECSRKTASIRKEKVFLVNILYIRTNTIYVPIKHIDNETYGREVYAVLTVYIAGWLELVNVCERQFPSSHTHEKL